MAEDSNSMQDSMGLSPQPSAVYGSPTQPVQIPQTRHPGQISVELTQQAQAQAANAASMTRMNNVQTGGIFNPAFAGGMSGGGSPLGTFGAQYSANSSMLASGHFNPYGPTAYGMMPQPGFNVGMMPMAGAVTDPTMGIYRNRLSMGGGVPVMPNLPRESLFHGPFYQPPSAPLFNTSMGQAMDMGTVRAAQYQGAFSSGVGVAARAGTDLVGGFVGGGLGALAGGVIGGPIGAKIGGALGSAAGFFGMDALAGQSAGQAALSNPVSNAAQRAAQMQGISNNFLVTGANLGPSGRGLDSASATNLQRYVAEAGYRGSASGFNPADLSKIMDVSSRNGLLDATQGLGDIKGRVTSTAAALRQFMQVANEPDIVNAIKELGTMRNMGFSLGEATMATQNARTYARMAGTTMRAMGEVGQAGAYTYQGFGLSAGLGSQMAMGGAALARQGVASGTFTEQQLAMLGGASGIGQRHAEMAASMLRIPMVAGSVSQMRPDGGFGINKDLLADLASGRMDINGMARSASSNLAAAAARGGPGAIGMYMMQQNELQDQVGRSLGPEGSQLMMMRQIQATAKMMGLNGPGGMATAAMTMFKGDPDAARQAVQLMSNPEYFKGLQQQVDVSRSEKSAENYAGIKAGRASKSSSWARPFRSWGYAFNTGGSYIDAASDTISSYFAEEAEDKANAEKGLTTGHINADLLATSDAERKNLRKMSAADIDAYADVDLKKAATQVDSRSAQMLFDNSDVYAYVRRKQGDGNSTWRQGTRRLFNTLSVGKLTQDDMDAAKAKFDRSAIAAGEIVNTSDAVQEKSYGELTTALGGDTAKADAVINDYAAEVKKAYAANQGGWSGLFEHGNFRNLFNDDEAIDQDKVEQAVLARNGITDPKVAALIRKAGGSVISAKASSESLDTERSAAAEGAGLADNMSDTAEERMEDLGDDAFSSWGSDEEHMAGMTALFGENDDPDAAVIASLLETQENGGMFGQKGDAEQRLKEYMQANNLNYGSASYRNARGLRARMAKDPSLKRMLLYLGQENTSRSAGDIRGIVDKQSKSFRANKALIALKDSGGDMLSAGDASDDIKKALGRGVDSMIAAVDAAGGSGKAFKQGSAIAQAYKKYEDAIAADPSKAAAAKTALKNAMTDYSPTTATKTRGRYDNGEYDGLKAGIAGTLEEAMQAFPETVGTFQKSSDTMLLAGQLLVKYAELWNSRTRLGPPGS